MVANNVADALRPVPAPRPGPPSPTHGHGRGPACCTPGSRAVDRAAIEARDPAPATEAGTPHVSPGLLVATQAVEVSLNINFDALHTSAAPLEPLIPAVRPGEPARQPHAGPVIIHQPSYGPRRDDPCRVRQRRLRRRDRLAWQSSPGTTAANSIEKLFGQSLDEVYATAWAR